MPTIEGWALREGVRQIQKTCGKLTQWCDVPGRADFDAADAEHWLLALAAIRDAQEAMLIIVDTIMGRVADDPEYHEPCSIAERCQREDGHDMVCGVLNTQGLWVDL